MALHIYIYLNILKNNRTSKKKKILKYFSLKFIWNYIKKKKKKKLKNLYIYLFNFYEKKKKIIYFKYKEYYININLY